MDKVKDVTKRGWHPQGKNGGKESWRGDNKGINQVAGWIGKGKDTNTTAQEHQSRPLASLKDPNAFGPPPKNVNYHGGAAVPHAITPDRRGLGAPISTEEIQAKAAEESRQAEEATRKPAPPPVPYRANTTGLNTRNLPKPPIRRLDQDGGGQTPSPTSVKPKPSLPPRLPPRQNSHPSIHAPDPPPTYTAAIQQEPGTQNDDFNVGALNRLGRAGVSVPGLGIGSKPQSTDTEPASSNPWASQVSNSATPSSPSPAQNAPLSGLQSRFSKLSTNPPSPPSQGTTMQQKQDALRTASAFHKDPSSLSLSDAKATASTANNFRERHGDQVAAGGRWAGGMNKKYDVAGKVNGLTGAGTGGSNAQEQTSVSQETITSPWTNEPSAGQGGASNTIMGGFKKAPPPPPHARQTGPPPVPLGSKPRS